MLRKKIFSVKLRVQKNKVKNDYILDYHHHRYTCSPA